MSQSNHLKVMMELKQWRKRMQLAENIAAQEAFLRAGGCPTDPAETLLQILEVLDVPPLVKGLAGTVVGPASAPRGRPPDKELHGVAAAYFVRTGRLPEVADPPRGSPDFGLISGCARDVEKRLGRKVDKGTVRRLVWEDEQFRREVGRALEALAASPDDASRADAWRAFDERLGQVWEIWWLRRRELKLTPVEGAPYEVELPWRRSTAGD